MNPQVAKAIKNRELKLLPIDKETEDIINSISRKMETNPIDVVSTAVDILRKCIGRRVIIQQTDTNIELLLKSLENYAPEVDLTPN